MMKQLLIIENIHMDLTALPIAICYLAARRALNSTDTIINSNHITSNKTQKMPHLFLKVDLRVGIYVEQYK